MSTQTKLLSTACTAFALLAIFLLWRSETSENDPDKGAASKEPSGGSPKQQDTLPERPPLSDENPGVSHNTGTRPSSSQSQAIYEKCIKLVESSGALSPESDVFHEIEGGLKHLIEERSELTSKLLNALPPGSNSAYLVEGAFKKTRFSSVSEIVEFVDSLALSEEFSNAASDSAFDAYISNMRIRSHLPSESSSDLESIDDLKTLTKLGVPNSVVQDLALINLNEDRANPEEVVALLGDIDDLSMSKVLANASHPKVGELIIAQSDAGQTPVDDQTIRAFASRYAGSSPREALGWAERLAGNGEKAAASGIFSTWADEDPMAASKHLLNMEHGDSRDQGVFELIEEKVHHGNRAEAREWLEEIQDPQLKQSANKLMENTEQ